MTNTIEKLQINFISLLKILPFLFGLIWGYANIMQKLTAMEITLQEHTLIIQKACDKDENFQQQLDKVRLKILKAHPEFNNNGF